MRALLLVALLAGTAQAEPGWELRVPERIDVAAGTSGTLPIAIAVDRGLSISKDAGLILDVAPAGGLTVKKRRLGRADAVDPDADAPRFAIPVRADAAGDFTMKVHVRLWLCAARTCRPVEARRTVSVAVSAGDTSKP